MCYGSIMITKWQGIGVGIGLKSWSLGILFEMDGKKMWQGIWQDVSDVRKQRQIGIAGKLS